MNEWTTTTLSKACGVTPQGINKFLEREGLKELGILDGNRRLYDEEVAKKVIEHFTKSSETVTETVSVSETVTEPLIKSNDSFSDLKEEIIFLRSQLEEKDKQIEQLIETNKVLSETNKALSAATTINTFAEKKEILLEPQELQTEQKQSKRSFSQWWRDLWS